MILKKNLSKDQIPDQIIPLHQGLDFSFKTPSSDKFESLSKSRSASINENLFEYLPTSKVTSSNIQEDTRFDTFIVLSTVPPSRKHP